MGQRSLRASARGLEKANLALASHSLSQNALAKDLGLSRSTVNKFFKGQPIDRENFALICDRLGLDLEATVVSLPPTEHEAQVSPSEIDALVQQVRQKVHHSIQKRCGTMRVLDMEQPLDLNSIYTTVNILEKLTHNQRRSLNELLEGCNQEDFDRFLLGRVQQERIPALKAVQRHDKLLILGKPGAGKTTFLKWLAIRCSIRELHPDRVPIFVTLKEFGEKLGQPTLLGFIEQQLQECGVSEAEAATTLLKSGRSLVLLDGLDEVRERDHDRVLQEICSTSSRFDASQFVMTCRIAAREYTFDQFTEVEVADFNDGQIKDFAQKWFREDSVKAEEFPQELQANPALQELGTNPLLLTLLCLVFGEQGCFPTNRAELYKEGLDVLLKKWDVKRNVRRDEVYKQLSLQRKEDLLSQIGFNRFERSEYFFKQQIIEEEIRDYIRNLPHASTDPEALQVDSEAVLRSIEAQHGLLVERARGIYSFSHLTFQEYFTARQIKESTNDELLPTLVSHITEKRWREVFLLTVAMQKNADALLLLMKREIDHLLAEDEKLQQFLFWVEQKACSVKLPYKSAAVRAFYLDRTLAPGCALNLTLALDLALVLDRTLIRILLLDLDLDRALDLALDLALDHTLAFQLDLARALDLDLDLALDRALVLNYTFAHDCTLAFDHTLTFQLQKLQQLRGQLPEVSFENWDNFRQWWETNGQAWTQQLRATTLEHRKIGHYWKSTIEQWQLLQQYYEANKLLVDCLNSECYVSREVREDIEATLLLPIAEIESFQFKLSED